MTRGPRVLGFALALLSVLALSLGLLARAGAQTSERCFSETPFCISGAFRNLWEQAGLPVFGFPLGPQGAPAPASATPADPTALQWFERQRFEYHPANPAPYTVLLGRLGAERLAQLGRDWQAAAPSTPQPGCRFFAETGRNLCPPFLAAWQARGLPLDGQPAVSFAESLALFGLPLTEAQEEEVEGRRFLVQWFERARLELHLGPDGAQTVLLGRLGAELLAAGAGGQLQPITDPLGPTITPIPAVTSGPPAGGAATVTATRVPPTATRAPRRPTSEPEPTEDSDPGPTSVLEPTSTSAPPPTSTRVPPPTSTRVPSPTPEPDPFTSPGTPPSGFPGSGNLPSASAGGQSLESLTGGQRDIGTVICFDIQSNAPDPQFTGEQDFVITDSSGAEVQTLTVVLDADTTFLRGRWVPGIDYAEGVYTITTVLPNLTPISGTLELVSPAAGSGPTLTMVRATDRLTESEINSCNDTIFGDPGDEFGVVLTGFLVNEVVSLHLYGTPGCAVAGAACYLGLLETVTVDANGQAYVPIPTEATYPSGRYIVLTTDQAIAAASDPTGQLGSFWQQRLTLR